MRHNVLAVLQTVGSLAFIVACAVGASATLLAVLIAVAVGSKVVRVLALPKPVSGSAIPDRLEVLLDESALAVGRGEKTLEQHEADAERWLRDGVPLKPSLSDAPEWVRPFVETLTIQLPLPTTPSATLLVLPESCEYRATHPSGLQYVAHRPICTCVRYQRGDMQQGVMIGQEHCPRHRDLPRTQDSDQVTLDASEAPISLQLPDKAPVGTLITVLKADSTENPIMIDSKDSALLNLVLPKQSATFAYSLRGWVVLESN